MKLVPALADIKYWFIPVLLEVTTPFEQFFTKYIFADMRFLTWLILVMIVDLITGIAKAIAQGGLKAVTSRGLRDTLIKCTQYFAFLIITHIVTHYEIGGKVATTDFNWIVRLACEFVLLIEVKSVYENIVAINPKLDFVSEVFKKIAKMFTKEELPKR